MSLDFLPRPVLLLIASWLLLYGPGMALLRGRPCLAPRAFLSVLASVITTTVAGTALAIGEIFSLPTLLLVNAAAGVTFLLLGAFVRVPFPAAPREGLAAESDAPGPAGRRDLMGPILVAAALATYWPAYPTFLGASDATVYVSTGVSLAHHGTFAREDELGASLPPRVRQSLFDSMSQVFGYSGPPYRRMPGGIMLESLEATRAWPCFFPVPSVWSAIFVTIGVPIGPSLHAQPEEAAPGYAPLFAALTLWAFWLLARGWLGPVWGLTAVVLLAASGPFYSAGRLSLSEPVAAYFTLAGLALLATIWRTSAPRAFSSAGSGDVEALLAGAALGTAVLVRVEIALILVLAAALMPGSREDREGPAFTGRLPVVFAGGFLALASLALVQAALLPGTYISPLLDHLGNAWIRYLLTYGPPSAGLFLAAALAGMATIGLGTRLFGLPATLRWGVVVTILVGHWAASNFLVERTPMWLSFYVGWAGLALAALGAVLAWRDRDRLPAGPFVLALAVSAAAILFYNPHVYPALPWGARRFVPVLLPLLLLLACQASAQVAKRSRLASLACAAILVFSVVQGGRPVWGQQLLEGAWEQLETISSVIPEEGTLLVDRDVSPMMLGPALWLVHDRNSVTVPSTLGSSRSQKDLPGLVWYLSRKGPVFLLTRGVGSPLPLPKVRVTRVTRTAASLRFMEQTYDRPPQSTQRYIMPLALYRLERSVNPNGVVTR